MASLFSGQFTLTLGVPYTATCGANYPLDLELSTGGVEDDPGDNSLSVAVAVARLFYLPLVQR